MKFFTAIKQSEFAAALLSAAGFNLEKLAAAGDINALKAHLDSLKPSADHAALSAKVTILTEENTTLNAALASAKSDNDGIRADLEKAVAAKTRVEGFAATMSAALIAKGVKCPVATGEKPVSQAEFEAAIDARISTKACEVLATAGHGQHIPNEPAANPAAAAKPAASSGLTGLARVKADFKAGKN